jgi:hypothetical protein
MRVRRIYFKDDLNRIPCLMQNIKRQGSSAVTAGYCTGPGTPAGSARSEFLASVTATFKEIQFDGCSLLTTT